MKYIFYPEDHGAAADGATLDTAALQAAIDVCHAAGGGQVVCGRGTYRTGSIDLKSNVELHVGPGAHIVGSADRADYRDFISAGFHHERANEHTARYLIGASHAQNVAITGPGEINGSGPEFYDQTQINSAGRFAVKPELRPRIVMFHQCRDVRFESARFVDSPCWTFWLMLCERVQVRGITILGDQRLLNCDGIDFDACRDVTVSDCIIHAEDDCLVCRAIQNVHDDEAICENVTVTNCVMSSTHQCIRISCPNDHIVRNCSFSNLTMRGRNGILIDLPQRYFNAENPCRAEVRGISFADSRIDCRSTPIRVAMEEGVQGVGISDISFSNMRITGGRSCVIQGNSSASIDKVLFHNVRLEIDDNEPLRCSGCRNVTFNNVAMTGRGQGPAQ
ncbi:MAG: glycoside hydrolase family 28 protein [Kiritimatiellia bacterium]|nr:hypothetical protein [Lentisphaerota bacterium]